MEHSTTMKKMIEALKSRKLSIGQFQYGCACWLLTEECWKAFKPQDPPFRPPLMSKGKTETPEEEKYYDLWHRYKNHNRVCLETLDEFSLYLRTDEEKKAFAKRKKEFVEVLAKFRSTPEFVARIKKEFGGTEV